MKCDFRQDKLKNILLSTYIFIFIFMLFNREFMPLGIDMRYIQVFIGIILLMFAFVGVENRKLTFLSKRNFGAIGVLTIIFYIYIVAINIKWLNNGLPLNRADFFNMLILSGANFISILVFYRYKNEILVKNIMNYIVISGIVLFLSMILVSLGVKLTDLMGGDYSGVYEGAQNINFFGQAKRVSGYAQDPNYASMFMLILGVSSGFYIKKKCVKYLSIIIALLGYMLSASKTIVIAFVFSIIFVVLTNLIKKKSFKINKILNISFVISVILLPYFIIKFMSFMSYSFNLDTMSTRMSMWKKAIELFEKSPLIGNGITSFRSAFEIKPGGWYVHSHSTIFQLMSETGIIGLLLFGIICALIIIKCNDYGKIMIITFLVFSITSELLHLSLFAFMIGLLPVIMQKETDLLRENKSAILDK